MVEINDIGNVMAECVVEFFNNENNLNLIDALFDAGVRVKDEMEALIAQKGWNADAVQFDFNPMSAY